MKFFEINLLGVYIAPISLLLVAAWFVTVRLRLIAPSAHDRSRFRALALFGRRPIERVAAIVFTGIQKPAQNQTFVGYFCDQ